MSKRSYLMRYTVVGAALLLRLALSQFTAGFGRLFSGTLPAGVSAALTLVLYALSYLLPTVLLCAFLPDVRKASGECTVNVRTGYRGHAAFTVAAAIGIGFVAGAVGSTAMELLRKVGVDVWSSGAVLTATPSTFVLYFVTDVIFAALFEEVFLRLYILRAFSAEGKANAVLFTALLFAVGHRPGGMLYAFVLGLMLAAMAFRYGTGVCIVTHMINNLIAFGIVVVSERIGSGTAFLVNIVAGIVFAAFACVFVIRKCFGIFDGYGKINAKLLLSPGVLAYICACVFVTAGNLVFS